MRENGIQSIRGVLAFDRSMDKSDVITGGNAEYMDSDLGRLEDVVGACEALS